MQESFFPCYQGKNAAETRPLYPAYATQVRSRQRARKPNSMEGRLCSTPTYRDPSNESVRHGEAGARGSVKPITQTAAMPGRILGVQVNRLPEPGQSNSSREGGDDSASRYRFSLYRYRFRVSA